MYISLRKICNGMYDYSLMNTLKGEQLVLTSFITTKREATKRAKELAKNLNINFRED